MGGHAAKRWRDEREALAQGLTFIRKGDQLVVMRLVPQARSILDPSQITAEIAAKKVDLVVLDQSIDTGIPPRLITGDRLLFHRLRRHRRCDGRWVGHGRCSGSRCGATISAMAAGVSNQSRPAPGSWPSGRACRGGRRTRRRSPRSSARESGPGRVPGARSPVSTDGRVRVQGVLLMSSPSHRFIDDKKRCQFIA